MKVEYFLKDRVLRHTHCHPWATLRLQSCLVLRFSTNLRSIFFFFNIIFEMRLRKRSLLILFWHFNNYLTVFSFRCFRADFYPGFFKSVTLYERYLKWLFYCLNRYRVANKLIAFINKAALEIFFFQDVIGF